MTLPYVVHPDMEGAGGPARVARAAEGVLLRADGAPVRSLEEMLRAVNRY